MEYTFTITLKRPNYLHINRISVLLIIIFLIAFLYHFLQTGIYKYNALLLPIPVIIIGLMLNGYFRRHQPDFLIYYRIELLIAAVSWFMLPLFADIRYIGWLYGIMAFIERYTKLPEQWIFSKEKVVKTGFPPKRYEWQEIENAMIRDNLFTLDLRTNKIFQKELETLVEAPLEEEFNEFCKQQLHIINTVV